MVVPSSFLPLKYASSIGKPSTSIPIPSQEKPNMKSRKTRNLCYGTQEERMNEITSELGFEIVRNRGRSSGFDATRKLVNVACEILNAVSPQIHGFRGSLFHLRRGFVRSCSSIDDFGCFFQMLNP